MNSAIDHATAPINQQLSSEGKISILRDIVRIRRFEQAALKQYTAGKMGGFLHLYNGQESVAVGTISLAERMITSLPLTVIMGMHWQWACP